MKKKKLNNLFLFIPLIIINIISLFNMLNAKYISSTYDNVFYKQLVWIIIGYILFALIQKINIKILFKFSVSFYIFTTLLLLLVLFIGKEVNGAKCWFQVFNISFQPSELAKISLPLLLITVLDRSKLKTIKQQIVFLLKAIIITLIPSVLVFLEPDTGAIINYLLILIVVIFSSKISKWFYFVFVILGLGFISSFVYCYLFNQDLLIDLIGTSFFYRVDRIINFANGSSYQLENALINIGSAPLYRFNLNEIPLYIPEAPTDFAFAFNIGNFGLISGFIVLISYFVICLYLVSNNKKIKRRKYKILVSSFNLLFIFQISYNILMNIGLVPIMGIPLSFLSYGGTSTLINFIILGIIYNIFNDRLDNNNYKNNFRKA